MVFRLRYLHHDFELPPGRFLIGRSTDCQLSLDDPLVSRKHALLIVTADYVEVQDLGSRNGVRVNNELITLPRLLGHGDQIKIGSQTMMISVPQTEPLTLRSHSSELPLTHVTVTAMEPVMPSQVDRVEKEVQAAPTAQPRPRETGEESTSKGDAFRLLGGVADKALALGRAEEAERLLFTLLQHVLQEAKSGRSVHDDLVDQAGYYGAKLAGATGKGSWVNYIIELHTLRRRPCSASTIDELHGVFRKVKDIDLVSLRAYLQMLREDSDRLSPAQRFLLQRIEGLERLVAAS